MISPKRARAAAAGGRCVKVPIHSATRSSRPAPARLGGCAKVSPVGLLGETVLPPGSRGWERHSGWITQAIRFVARASGRCPPLVKGSRHQSPDLTGRVRAARCDPRFRDRGIGTHPWRAHSTDTHQAHAPRGVHILPSRSAPSANRRSSAQQVSLTTIPRCRSGRTAIAPIKSPMRDPDPPGARLQ